ncbi:hypothetical protein, partial [Burkholderia ubonensis]|uniref:hypothetical protein n=1 Tax=Burkholderia ubonensis TaxID=101571 RepID=UPI001C42F24D
PSFAAHRLQVVWRHADRLPEPWRTAGFANRKPRIPSPALSAAAGRKPLGATGHVMTFFLI